MVTNSANLDKVQVQKKETDTTLASKLSLEAQDAQRAKSATPANAGQADHAPAPPAASTAESHLPGLDFIEGLGHVAGDIVKGAVDEAVNHPLTLVKDAAIGAVAGVATVAALAVLPEGLAGVAIVGGVAAAAAALGGYEVVKSNGGIANTEKAIATGATNLWHQAESLGHSVSVEMNEKNNSAADVRKAKVALNNVGSVGIQFAAGAAGSFGAGSAALLVKGALTAATVETAASTAALASAPLDTAATVAPVAVGETVAPAVADASALAAPAAVGDIAPTVIAQDTTAAATSAAVADTAPLASAEAAPVVGADASQAAPLTDAAMNEALLTAKVAEEFGPLSPADQEFAMGLAEKAQAEGVNSPAFYAATRLTDPADISRFARIYANSSETGLANMKFAANSGRVADGTEDTWKSILAKIKPAPLTEAARKAALQATVSSEFGDLSAKNQTFALSLAEKAEQEGFKSPSYWAATTLTDPADINQFTQIYANTPLGLHNLSFVVDKGRVVDGTEDIWKAALAKMPPTPEQPLN